MITFQDFEKATNIPKFMAEAISIHQRSEGESQCQDTCRHRGRQKHGLQSVQGVLLRREPQGWRYAEIQYGCQDFLVYG